MTPREALTALLESARSVSGLVAEEAGKAPGKLSLPCVVVGAPALKWEISCGDPSSATFPVTLMVRLDDLAVEKLLSFVSLLQGALEDDTAASIMDAFPVSYNLGPGVDAAGYELTVEYPL